MEFIPFSAPASDHDPFHTGLSAEKGVTPKNFVEGVNAYFTHIFQVLKGDITYAVEVVDDDARTALLSLAEHVTSLEKKMEAAQAEIAAMKASPAPQTVAAPEGEQPASNQQGINIAGVQQGAGTTGLLQAALIKAAVQ